MRRCAHSTGVLPVLHVDHRPVATCFSKATNASAGGLPSDGLPLRVPVPPIPSFARRRTHTDTGHLIFLNGLLPGLLSPNAFFATHPPLRRPWLHHTALCTGCIYVWWLLERLLGRNGEWPPWRTWWLTVQISSLVCDRRRAPLELDHGSGSTFRVSPARPPRG